MGANKSNAEPITVNYGNGVTLAVYWKGQTIAFTNPENRLLCRSADVAKDVVSAADNNFDDATAVEILMKAVEYRRGLPVVNEGLRRVRPDIEADIVNNCVLPPNHRLTIIDDYDDIQWIGDTKISIVRVWYLGQVYAGIFANVCILSPGSHPGRCQR